VVFLILARSTASSEGHPEEIEDIEDQIEEVRDVAPTESLPNVVKVEELADEDKWDTLGVVKEEDEISSEEDKPSNISNFLNLIFNIFNFLRMTF
jgi:hypothetical protein